MTGEIQPEEWRGARWCEKGRTQSFARSVRRPDAPYKARRGRLDGHPAYTVAASMVDGLEHRTEQAGAVQ
ncbi:hypothetical protein GCM10010211_85180 [Streptomyces albospinus]|uniref:Transposase n=1 Tax=Streptomyces albospinus TaxID=285515 RepID=A0ABQ2VPL7_9ACTN|nr:hypothetical protein GCM10010211_85180 [Streptomyces albospinus]